MKTTLLGLLALTAAALAGYAENAAPPAKMAAHQAETTTPPAEAVSPQAETAPPPVVIDAEADQALRSMCDLLKSTSAFHLRVNAAADKMSPAGRLVQVTRQSDVLVRQPDGIAAEVTSEHGKRSLRYKGKSLSLLDTGRKQYATIQVPGNIDEMFDFLFDEYDLTVPLADLLFSDPYAVLTENVQTGVYLGLHVTAGTPCHHLLFTQENVDWQVWIDAGEGAKPLPRRVVITYKQEPNQPQFIADLSDWNLAPTIDGAAFDFKKPADAKLVDMKDLLGQKAGASGSTPGAAGDRQEPLPAEDGADVAVRSLADGSSAHSVKGRVKCAGPAIRHE